MNKIFLIIIVTLVFQVEAFSQQNDASIEELVEKGDVFFEKEDYVNSIIYYSKALEGKKDLAKIYKKRAGAHYSLGQYENAISDYTATINQEPEDVAETYFMRDLSKSVLKKEDKKGACTDFRKAKTLGFDLSEMNGLNEYCGVTDLE